MGVPGWLRELWDRVVATDPGLSRLRIGLSAAIYASSSLAVEYGFVQLTGAGSALVPMLLGAIVAMISAMALTGTSSWAKIRTAVFFPVAMGVGMALGVLASAQTATTLTGFIVAMFLAVYVRRFGPSFFFYGFMGWMGFFFANFLHAKMAMLPGMILAVAIATVWVTLLSVTVLRTNSPRTLRRTVRAFDARARAVIRASAELVEHPGTQRLRRRLHSRQARLGEAALMVEAWSAEPGAMPGGWSAPALRRALLNAQHAVDGIAAAAFAMPEADTELRLEAANVLERLARRDEAGAEHAAHALAETVEYAAEESEQDGTGGWWPARHLAVAVLEFADLARRVQTPQQDETVDEFEPVVTLAMGALPGSFATARDVPARGGRWNPLARLEMSTRQAIQAGVAGALALFAGRELSEARYYWAVIAAFIMFAGTTNRSETFLKGFNRVLGTLVGLFAAIGLGHLTHGHIWWVLTVIVACMFFGNYLMRVSYAYMIFFITVMIGQLYSVLNELSTGFLLLRLEETAIGAAAGALVALVVVPLSTRDTARTARDGVLTALGELLNASAQRLSGSVATGGPPPDLDALARSLDDRMRQLSLLSKPMTRPLLWGNSPIRTRHRISLYAAATTQARALAAALRNRPHYTIGPAGACLALASVATELTHAKVGEPDPEVAPALAEADTALFAHARVSPGARARDPLLQPLIQLHRLLREIAVAGQFGATPSSVPNTRRAAASVDAAVLRGAPPPVDLVERCRDSALIAGHITREDGTPFANGVVLLLDTAGHPKSRTSSDENGDYRIENCPAGEYVVTTIGPGHRPAAARAVVLAGRITRTDLIIDASEAPAEQLHRAGGKVSGPNGNGPVPEASLTVLDGAGTVIASTNTDQRGRYQLPALPKGDYTVVAAGYQPTSATVRVRGGQDQNLDLNLSP